MNRDMDDLQGRDIPRCEGCGMDCLGPLTNGRILCGHCPDSEDTGGEGTDETHGD